jgi:hypothetical protein
LIKLIKINANQPGADSVPLEFSGSNPAIETNLDITRLIVGTQTIGAMGIKE